MRFVADRVLAAPSCILIFPPPPIVSVPEGSDTLPAAVKLVTERLPKLAMLPPRSEKVSMGADGAPML